MSTTISGSTEARSPSAAGETPVLTRSTVRELVIALAALEDRLRTAVPSERATLLRELGDVVRELRRRRDRMRALARHRR